MINEQKNTLDETIKQSLSNYEAPYDENDWAKMEKTLDVAPKTSTFKWPYAIRAVVVLAVVSGGYLLYNNWSSYKTKTSTPTQPIENSPTPVVKTSPTTEPSAITKPKHTIETKAETNVIVNGQVDKTKEVEVSNVGKISKEETLLNEKTKSNKTKEGVYKEKQNEDNKLQQVIIMGNEPVFGDMLDSTKGIIRESKEKEETKQAAKKPSEYPIGWNSFMLSNVNPDSIKHYRESIKKDSIK